MIPQKDISNSLSPKISITEYKKDGETVQELNPTSPVVPSLRLATGSTLDLNSEVNAKLALLRAIGITPELLFSSRIMDPTALIALLAGNQQGKNVLNSY